MEQAETLSQVTKFSLESAAVAANNAGHPADVEGIRVIAWRANKEKHAARSSVLFNREDSQLAAEAAGPAGVIAAAAVAPPRDRKLWEKSIDVQFVNFKANHRLGRCAAKARNAAKNPEVDKKSGQQAD